MTERKFDFQALKDSLKNEDSDKVADLISQIDSLRTSKKKDGSFTCKWFTFLTIAKAVELFKKAKSQELYIDNKHIIIENRGGKIGLSYDYIAYKNKLLTIYPSAKFDFNVVYKDDDFFIEKKDGKVFYNHKLNNPFNNKNTNVIGAYCIIKISTGDFFITLDLEEIAQLRKKASNDSIWQEWFKDMCIKSVIKKLVSKHFDDIYREINEDDNETINLENPIDIELELKQEIDEIEDLEKLKVLYDKKKNNIKNQKSFIGMLTIRKEDIIKRDKILIEDYQKLVNIKESKLESSEIDILLEEFTSKSYQNKIKLFEELKSK